ncbi:hypothetical protein [Streptomyces sp. NPDC059816]|uniref:hypothetical protein n=1 Tax=Streptomyces sp. NPDC059816 TaxID=3346960 RepID=UPI00365A27A0
MGLLPRSKSVDASVLLARTVTPELMRPGWVDALKMSRSVLPHARMLTLDERLEHAAAKPVIVPEMRGRPTWARIAAVTGRDPEQLRKTLDTVKCKRCGSDFAVTRTFGVMPVYCSTRCRIPQKHPVMEPCRICRQPMKIQFGQRHRL